MPAKPGFLPDDGLVRIARGDGAPRAQAPVSRATRDGQAASLETGARFRAGGPAARLVSLVRIAAWLALLAIVVLSVVPGAMRPRILGSDYLEHFTAYFMTAGLLAIGYRRPLGLLASGLILTLCAGGLELVQLWIPDRTARIADFSAGMLGAWCGILAGLAATWSNTLRGPRRP